MLKEIVKIEIYPRGPTTCDDDCPYFIGDPYNDNTIDSPFCDLFFVPLDLEDQDKNIAFRCRNCKNTAHST